MSHAPDVTHLAEQPDPATRRQHQDMGFEQGRGAAFDKLVALVG